MKTKQDFRRTTAKVKDALFNILRGRIEDSTFLDLYAGEGSVGFEAIRRGAKRVVFVEYNRTRCRKIASHIKEKRLGGLAELHCEDAKRFVTKTTEEFDIIFLDPPYESGEIERILPLLSEKGKTVVVEHSRRDSIKERYNGLILKKQYSYGDTFLSLYEKA